MEIFYVFALPLATWFGFSFVIFMFFRLYGWAKKQKATAFALGMLVQMFLPDPKAQETIEIVVEAKQKESRKTGVVQPRDKDKQ